MSQNLTVYNSRLGHMIVSKTIIEKQATEAAHAGQSLNDACPYPFTSEAGMHFKAVYLLALPKQAPTQNSEGAPV
jgi:hypothetical protein